MLRFCLNVFILILCIVYGFRNKICQSINQSIINIEINNNSSKNVSDVNIAYDKFCSLILTISAPPPEFFRFSDNHLTALELE